MHTTSIQKYLDSLIKRLTPLEDGAVADYIPELGKADPSLFGIAIVTVDGNVYQSGDTSKLFSIQSISKAFTYGIALEDKGVDTVYSRIDVEPSGEAFNSISLEPETGRPKNPMINAGAIVSASLVDGDSRDEKIGRIVEKFSTFAGRPLEINKTMYESERDTGHRNRAIKADVIPNVLSVMSTCGMYDYSGNWMHKVGMPAKSGVGGGVVAVLPGQLALAVFSPNLDAKGNSARGIAVCEAMSAEFGLHMLRVSHTTMASVIRALLYPKVSQRPEPVVFWYLIFHVFRLSIFQHQSC